jgi:hypothetical protein
MRAEEKKARDEDREAARIFAGLMKKVCVCVYCVCVCVWCVCVWCVCLCLCVYTYTTTVLYGDLVY